MPRKAHLEPHLSSPELKERYQHSQNKVESRRWHLLWLVCQGWQIKQAAAAVGFNYDYAREIVKTYNEQGAQSLAKRRRQTGKKAPNALLNEEQLAQLKQALRCAPADGGLWSGPKVARWIAQTTGKPSVHAQRGWDYLKRCRFSPSTSPSTAHES